MEGDASGRSRFAVVTRPPPPAPRAGTRGSTTRRPPSRPNLAAPSSTSAAGGRSVRSRWSTAATASRSAAPASSGPGSVDGDSATHSRRSPPGSGRFPDPRDCGHPRDAAPARIARISTSDPVLFIPGDWRSATGSPPTDRYRAGRCRSRLSPPVTCRYSRRCARPSSGPSSPGPTRRGMRPRAPGPTSDGTGLARACRSGNRVGPLFAERPANVTRFFPALPAALPGKPLLPDLSGRERGRVRGPPRHARGLRARADVFSPGPGPPARPDLRRHDPRGSADGPLHAVPSRPSLQEPLGGMLRTLLRAVWDHPPSRLAVACGRVATPGSP